MDLRAPCTRTGSAQLTRPEGRDLSLSLENRLLRPGACATSWTGTPLCFSQPLNPKLPSTLCSLTSPPLTLLRPLTSPFLKTESEKPSPRPEYLRQQEARIEDSINKEQQVLEDPAEESELLPSYNLSAQEYEDLEQARGALVDEELRDVPDPSQNQDAGLQEKKEALLNGVCCSLIQGGKFTDADNATRQDLLALCQAVAEQEPEFVLKVALYTRQELNIRSTANFLLALGAWLPPCRPHLRRYFCRTVRLPSDWIEVAKIYQSLAESSRKIAPYPSCLRRSLADSFKLFDEYQLAKYNTRKQRCKSDPRKQRRIQKPPSDLLIAKWSKCLSLAKADVTQLVAESTPVQKEKKPKDHFSLKKLVRWLHLKEPTYNIMCLLGRRYPSDLQSFARSRLPGPWDSRRAGKRMKFQVPETWDRQLSLRGNNVKVWEELIDNQNLPFMAMLRNLRNVIVAGISSQHHKQILEKLTNRKSVIHSRQFPFRFLAAYKVLDELQQRLEEKDEPLPTREALTQEAMGSVKLPPRRSWLLRDRASVLAAQKRVQGISFIHWWVTKRLEQLRKIR
ncbi:telomerase protein component 1 [Scyliorhinus canicula]|uniref:telomerase protein component 1 n=1 Tax=Scyliorhinus canicula TaxID=7830 RepID=UPI0018F7B4EC|nr:telomerase protein component 1 [Scyliorhinus canicula]